MTFSFVKICLKYLYINFGEYFRIGFTKGLSTPVKHLNALPTKIPEKCNCILKYVTVYQHIRLWGGGGGIYNIQYACKNDEQYNIFLF